MDSVRRRAFVRPALAMVALVLAAGLTNQTAAIAAPAKPGRPSIDTAFPRDGAAEISVKLGHHNKKINRLEVTSQPDGRSLQPGSRSSCRCCVG